MSDGGDLDAEVPAASPPADAASEAVPTSETPPVPEIPVHESASPEELTASPIEEREIQAAPAVPEPPEPEPVASEERAVPETADAPESTATPPASVSSSPPPLETAEKAAVSSAATPATPATSAILPISARLGEALEALRFRKKARLEKILQLAAKKGRIKNDDVEKLLRVSDSTAQRYLNQLVVQAKLRRVGHAKQPHYEPL